MRTFHTREPSASGWMAYCSTWLVASSQKLYLLLSTLSGGVSLSSQTITPLPLRDLIHIFSFRCLSSALFSFSLSILSFDSLHEQALVSLYQHGLVQYTGFLLWTGKVSAAATEAEKILHVPVPCFACSDQLHTGGFNHRCWPEAWLPSCR